MLFWKECRKVICSLTFFIYCVAVLAFYFTQFHSDSDRPPQKPLPGDNDYGMIAREVPEILMPAAIDSLVGEYLSKGYVAYPHGFFKLVFLKQKEQARMAEIIFEVSGITREELDSFENYRQGGYIEEENGDITYLTPIIPEVTIPETLTYEHFRELMREADEIIGGGSTYSDLFIVHNFSLVPKTYEEALAEYEHFIQEDKITSAYARLFCDYFGVLLSILPVFVAVSLASLDKRSGMEQLAYSRKISSARLVFTRYFSLVTVLLIPVFFTALIAYAKIKSIYPDNDLDHFAILKYTAFWLVPNIMTASAIGMLITEISSGLIAIFVQGAWWFTSITSAMDGLTGNIGKFTLVMRHNSLLEYDVFMAQWSSIVFNRIFFTVLSILAIALTVFIYEQKRRGVFHGFQIPIQNFKRQSQA